MHAVYFVDEREVTCWLAEAEGLTAVAMLSSPQQRGRAILG
jgi:hypothetical protein